MDYNFKPQINIFFKLQSMYCFIDTIFCVTKKKDFTKLSE